MPDSDIIDADVKPLAVQDAKPVAGLFSSDDPEEIIAQATRRANVLMKVVRQQGFAKNIQGREFLQLEAWQTIAALSGVTPFCEWSKPTENGWEARVVVRNRAGIDIAAAEAQCTRKERTWSNRDDYALRSMAQTRAAGKALRSCLSFIAVLAGFEATPAEEMPETLASRRAGRPGKARPTQDTPSTPEAQQKPGEPQETPSKWADPTPISAENRRQVEHFVENCRLTPTEVELLLDSGLHITSVAELKTNGEARRAYAMLIEAEKEVQREIPL